MLEIKNLCKNYGKLAAVTDLSLTIPDGCIYGFIGPNGAGKTTTFKILAGLLTPTSGEAYIDGESITQSRRTLAEKIGYMPDFFGVYDNLKVTEYMDFYAGAYYIPYEKREGIINNLLELVELTEKKNAYVDSLSRGMKQRLCLARSLIHDPSVLLLDEPASGLDPRARVEMKEVLKQLKTLGKTVIISSHILPELAEFCTSIGIIKSGRLVANGTVSEIMQKLKSGRIIMVKTVADYDTEGLVNILKEKPYIAEISQSVDGAEFAFEGEETDVAALIKELVVKDVPIVSVKEKEGNLEEIFMQLTNEEGDNA